MPGMIKIDWSRHLPEKFTPERLRELIIISAQCGPAWEAVLAKYRTDKARPSYRRRDLERDTRRDGQGQ